MPEAPDHFSRCSDINRKGPALIRSLPTLAAMDPASFAKRSQEKNTIVLDIRSYEAFGGHMFQVRITSTSEETSALSRAGFAS